jgi:tripartite-type tricarboxylate transporter receptor subunit TctC
MSVPNSLKLAGFACIAAAAVAAPAAAQTPTFPTRPMTIIAGVPPGGIIDWMARTVGAGLQARWGQPVVVENRGGANGWIAAQAVQKAPPDGHTLFAWVNTGITMPLLTKAASFEPGRDIEPLTPVLFAPYVIITNTQMPAANLKEFVAYAKANPGKLNWASGGGSQRVDTFYFLRQNDLDIVIINYQGGAPALRSLLANETQAYFGAVFGLDAQVKAGKVRALAVTSPARFPVLPDVPTVKEALGTDLNLTVQYGFFTGGGVPKPIVDRLAREIADLARGEMAPQIRKQGYEPLTMTPEEWTRAMRSEFERFRGVVGAAGVQPE